jgi:hypothetical protein
MAAYIAGGAHAGGSPVGAHMSGAQTPGAPTVQHLSIHADTTVTSREFWWAYCFDYSRRFYETSENAEPLAETL